MFNRAVLTESESVWIQALPRQAVAHPPAPGRLLRLVTKGEVGLEQVSRITLSHFFVVSSVFLKATFRGKLGKQKLCSHQLRHYCRSCSCPWHFHRLFLGLLSTARAPLPILLSVQGEGIPRSRLFLAGGR